MTDPRQTVLEGNTDAELVELARLGCKDAFSTLVQRHQGSAQRFAARLARDTGWASELVQEATLQSYLSLEHLRDPSKFKGWLCGIMLNVHRNRLREQQACVPFNGILPSSMCSSDLASPERSAEENELHKAVMETLGVLLPNDRTTLMMFYFEEMSLFQIAAKIGISETAAKVRLHRARQRFKDTLERRHPDVIPFARRKLMVKVSIADVVKQDMPDAEGRAQTHYVVVLEDKVGKRALPIWIGRTEAQAIAAGIGDFSLPRPMTVDFMSSLLQALDARIEAVVVNSLQESTYFATVRVVSGESVREVDARPSDALALAVRMKTPIFVSDEVLKLAGVPIPRTAKPGRNHKGAESIVREIEQTYKGARQVIASVFGE